MCILKVLCYYKLTNGFITFEVPFKEFMDQSNHQQNLNDASMVMHGFCLDTKLGFQW